MIDRNSLSKNSVGAFFQENHVQVYKPLLRFVWEMLSGVMTSKTQGGNISQNVIVLPSSRVLCRLTLLAAFKEWKETVDE